MRAERIIQASMAVAAAALIFALASSAAISALTWYRGPPPGPQLIQWYDVPSTYSLEDATVDCQVEGGELGVVLCPIINGLPLFCRARCDKRD